MKKFALIAFALLLNAAGFAQDFKTVLEKTFTAFDTSWNAPDKQIEYSNKLGLIAKKFDKEWAAAYYAAYSKVQLSYTTKDNNQKDAVLDEADALIDQAVSILGKDNDETYVIKAMIAAARMSVDPQNRWQKYGKLFTESLDKAKEVNADNPRIYLQLGINKYFTPEMWGGGKKAALPYLQKAEELYTKVTSDDITTPHWGAKTNAYFLGLANGTIKEEKN